MLIVLTLSACASEHGEETLRETRVTIRLENATLRQFFHELERQAGISIAAECRCGWLQEIVDEPGFSLILENVPVRAAPPQTFTNPALPVKRVVGLIYSPKEGDRR